MRSAAPSAVFPSQCELARHAMQMVASARSSLYFLSLPTVWTRFRLSGSVSETIIRIPPFDEQLSCEQSLRKRSNAVAGCGLLPNLISPENSADAIPPMERCDYGQFYRSKRFRDVMFFTMLKYIGWVILATRRVPNRTIAKVGAGANRSQETWNLPKQGRGLPQTG